MNMKIWYLWIGMLLGVIMGTAIGIGVERYRASRPVQGSNYRVVFDPGAGSHDIRIMGNQFNTSEDALKKGKEKEPDMVKDANEGRSENPREKRSDELAVRESYLAGREFVVDQEIAQLKRDRQFWSQALKEGTEALERCTKKCLGPQSKEEPKVEMGPYLYWSLKTGYYWSKEPPPRTVCGTAPMSPDGRIIYSIDLGCMPQQRQPDSVREAKEGR